MNQQPQQLQIKADDETLKGHYTNAMQVAHTKEEFILDFFMMSQPAGQLVDRIITSPAHMKQILKALQDNIKIYESSHGAIKEAGENQPKIGFGV